LSTHYALSRLCVKHLGDELARPARRFFRLPTVVAGVPFVNDPEKYHKHDQAFELSHRVLLPENHEPSQASLERALQGRVSKVLGRIETGLTLKRSFLRIPTPRGQRREIDLLCEDDAGRPVVIEFKRFGENHAIL
jgi:hypothetical protein